MTKQIKVIGCSGCPAAKELDSIDYVSCGISHSSGVMECRGIVERTTWDGVKYTAHLYVLKDCPLDKGCVTLEADFGRIID